MNEQATIEESKTEAAKAGPHRREWELRKALQVAKTHIEYGYSDKEATLDYINAALQYGR